MKLKLAPIARACLLPAALAGALLPVGQSAHAATTLSFDKVWTFNHIANSVPGQLSEIAAFDAATSALWVVGVVGVDVLDAATGALLQHIDTSAVGSANSVAIHNGLAAIAIESAADRTAPGTVQFYDTATRALASGVNSVQVGALPDMVTFTPAGDRLLVANEATPTTYGGFDPAGSVTIIDMSTRTVAATAGFAGVPQTGPDIRTQAIVGMDFEPEYIAVNSAGTRAFVTLQEANAVGVLDIATGSFTSVIGLGTKDFSQPGNEIDPNNRDSRIELRSADVRGLYQPDSIAAYEANGQTYVVMANEGDTREDDGDKERVKNLPALAGAPADLKELNVSTVDSTPGDIVTFGGRSFSIRDEAGNIVFDSGSRLDAEAIARGIYDDGRSDDKGVEPEGVALKEIDGRVYAFIGLERTTTGAVAVYDITDPANSTFVDMIVTDGDVSPEGLATFTMGGKHYLAIANEVSGTTTLYAMAPVPEPQTYALMAAGLAMLGAGVKRRRAVRG